MIRGFWLSMLLVPLLAASGWTDLTGQWSCDDGGTYYLRQTGDTLHWYGEAAANRPAWAHVFSGRVADHRITGRWVDVPKGRSMGSGTLELVVEADGDRLRLVKKDAGFGGSRWTRKDASADAGPLSPLKPAGKEDCARFDPQRVTIRQADGHWKLVDGTRWLFDFGDDAAAASRALAVVRHYRMDRICFVGRPDPAMTYLLARGGVPSGAMAGDDCVAFDPQKASVSNVRGRWMIVSAKRRLLDFGSRHDEAREALAAIRRHGFTRICTVGRPEAGFSYLRR